jgi:hypothetical protein
MNGIDRANTIAQCKTSFDPEKERRTLQCSGIFTGYYGNDPNMVAQLCCERKVDAQIQQQQTISPTPSQSDEKVDKLAKQKDPELAKREAEAKAQTAVADKRQELLAQKTKIEAQTAEKILLLVTLYLAFPPKLPALNPKALAKKKQAEEKKESREEKQLQSKENVKKSKDVYTYPIKPTQSEKSAPTAPPLPLKAAPTSGSAVPPTTQSSMKYYIEIIDRGGRGVWAVEVYDVTQTKSFVETVTYSKTKYPTKDSVIKLVTDLIRTTGYVEFPPQPNYTFP